MTCHEKIKQYSEIRNKSECDRLTLTLLSGYYYKWHIQKKGNALKTYFPLLLYQLLPHFFGLAGCTQKKSRLKQKGQRRDESSVGRHEY